MRDESYLSSHPVLALHCNSSALLHESENWFSRTFPSLPPSLSLTPFLTCLDNFSNKSTVPVFISRSFAKTMFRFFQFNNSPFALRNCLSILRSMSFNDNYLKLVSNSNDLLFRLIIRQVKVKGRTILFSNILNQ